ncbi:ErfK/YbiS/YcfS/YnhG family protein [Dinoroseobacter shibae DFL 12 = DSM 16493]|jgi:lipoprotein-anchoring transpeptidase ErfK/SrfK|uniref:ErfK/YbiS/YcfS/YnhG family protein n=1 Tax=Dinoroseobacter shibae (strain DSM 16493 / NCIMB 14021 / DFL 12) TaxID=398580 RepID=A8LPG4_DINSH|nr:MULTISPECIES: L,D-transpeptidase [Dinoroseobacter]ABV95229.1 ErfK/YbiS/YcfS/YnhG family protein [Dinoroseobacter shibae DFL 12 = DSM 16493]MDD9718052.1 L,D-transpeptidase [Dinoroseobacter sp. PD6]URF46642.1 L,D-transpeptidase [Dinoroseobacter shibae]URF50948.1 L,D-transpeptidase [Dinoroseobacter shibae]
MSKDHRSPLSRRRFLAASGAASTLLASPALAQMTGTTELEQDVTQTVRRNVSSFRALDWRPYFSNTRNGAVLVDISSRALHFWSEDQTEYKLYPTSVPLTEDLTRTGRTSITKKVEGPSWRPTPAMRQRNPEWPEFIPPGPDNPMGTHAMHLTWTYYRIHGTHDTRKIGRRSSNGCIGLFNEDIAELYSKCKVGTQVLLI